MKKSIKYDGKNTVDVVNSTIGFKFHFLKPNTIVEVISDKLLRTEFCTELPIHFLTDNWDKFEQVWEKSIDGKTVWMNADELQYHTIISNFKVGDIVYDSKINEYYKIDEINLKYSYIKIDKNSKESLTIPIKDFNNFSVIIPRNGMVDMKEPIDQKYYCKYSNKLIEETVDKLQKENKELKAKLKECEDSKIESDLPFIFKVKTPGIRYNIYGEDFNRLKENVFRETLFGEADPTPTVLNKVSHKIEKISYDPTLNNFEIVVKFLDNDTGKKYKNAVKKHPDLFEFRSRFDNKGQILTFDIFSKLFDAVK